MKKWNLVWSPEGRVIATVYGMNGKAALAQVPGPWRKYKGEVYALEAEEKRSRD